MKLNIDTKDLQDFLGCEKSRASQIINGHVKPSAALALKISQKFGTPLWELRPDIYPEHLFNKDAIHD
jgi:plasmid maintenance system antidote protein VapI